MLLSFLSTGTTWMQEIVTLISSRGDPHVSQTVPNWTRAPWLEHHFFTAILEASSTTPRVITTHLPHHLLGPALQGSKAKVKFTCLFDRLPTKYRDRPINWPGQLVFIADISVSVYMPADKCREIVGLRSFTVSLVSREHQRALTC